MIEQLDWEEIKKTALLGTDRRSLTPALITQAQSLGIDTDAPPEKILAALLLAANLLIKTARIFPQAALKTASIMEQNNLTPCPVHIAALLPKILKNEWEEILQEFAEVLQNRGWRFPTQFVPALLDRAVEEPSFWHKIKPLITSQAQWLIQQNPKWRDLAPQSRTQKLAFSPEVYAAERTIDSSLANDQLKQQWPSLKKVKKLQYLLQLEKHIVQDDESFILSIWAEKIADVKHKLFDLLLRIPNSEISKKRSTFLPKVIDKKKKITLPEWTDENKSELKLIARHSEFKGGLKANLLTQFLAGTNWKNWEDNFDLNDKNFSGWIKKQEWSEQILQALLQIIARENNSALRTIIYKFYHQSDTALPEDLSLLFKGMSAEQFNQLSSWSYAQGASILNDEGIFIKMALAFEPSWPKEATFGFFKITKIWLIKNPRYWEGWYIWQIIRRLSFRADPKELPLMLRAFQQDQVWSLADDEINKFLSILKFRQQLYID